MKFNFFTIKVLLFYTLIFWGMTCSSKANTAPNVWEVLRYEFTLNHETSRVEVQDQIQWFIAHPGFINKVCRQSEPYIYHIINEVKKKKLPGELALLPMIESAFDPFAYSVAGAAGLWQLMPLTGKDLGLTQDWWFDGRRSINSSTDAALNYLLYLNNFFNGDWILAIAAYDAGAGTIDRAIKAIPKSRNTISFWELSVPRETQIYVPRLLALAEIISNPDRYKLVLPEIAYLPYFEEVNIGTPIDLSHAAKMAGMSYKDLIKLNPGFNRWTTAPNKPFKLLIPTEKVQQFYLNLANLPEHKRVSWEMYQVQPGDSLDNIAVKYHTTVNFIKQLNQLTTNQLKPHQSLLIPSTKNTPVVVKKEPTNSLPMKHQMIASSVHRIIHIVQINDNYDTLARTYGINAQQIKTWNKIKNNQPLYKGQQLIIFKKINQPTYYVVKKGDSLSNIAQKHQTQIERLLALNPGLTRNTSLYLGQKIFIG
ncbi:LysM peptidoglycan-binding domain-containing protein [Legionella longbeachae]|uniref:Membrane-bound lytic murein transglycosylase D n=1 Tax=Legionella longbeachae serogroup 1 (strain NSW150) TaxID=661367 RepID=D3HRJ0_LEGLN|nr:membrane-bound lytic murein transglycosylase D [Legionella longbeachae NSW150]